MHKDFDDWNNQKKKIQNFNKRALFNEREIWWCRLGVNVGDEQDGKGFLKARPVLVLKKFNHNIFLGVPLSTQIKDKKYYYKFHFKGIEQSLLLSQIRVIDSKRFLNKIGILPEPELVEIKEKLKELLL